MSNENRFNTPNDFLDPFPTSLIDTEGVLTPPIRENRHSVIHLNTNVTAKDARMLKNNIEKMTVPKSLRLDTEKSTINIIVDKTTSHIKKNFQKLNFMSYFQTK